LCVGRVWSAANSRKTAEDEDENGKTRWHPNSVS